MKIGELLFMADIFQIENGVLKKCTDEKATSVTIPDGVKEITWMAFRRCTKLETLIIPSSVVRISKMAFINCMSLSKIVLADDFKKVPSVWFEILNLKNPNYEIVCTKDSPTYKSVKRSPKLRIHIKEIALQIAKDKKVSEVKGSTAEALIVSLLENIADSSFSILISTKLATIVLVKVGKNAGFFKLGSNYSCWLPKIQKVIEYFADSSKSGAEIFDLITEQKLPLAETPKCILDDRVVLKGDFEGNLRIFASGSLYEIKYDGVKSLELFGISEIGNYALFLATSIQSVVIPNSVTRLGYRAFMCCTSLVSVEILNSCVEIDRDAFKLCNIDELSHPCLTIKNGVAIKDNKVVYWTSRAIAIEIPDGVTEISFNAFDGCTKLSSIKIPDTVTSIGCWAFRDCSSLESVEIPNSVTSIGQEVFKSCTSLKSAKIPVSIRRPGVFNNCTSLEFLEFTGTMAQWDSVPKKLWAKDSKITSVKCTDGVIPL